MHAFQVTFDGRLSKVVWHKPCMAQARCSGFRNVTYLKKTLTLKGRVGKNGETSSSALEFESTLPKKICAFIQTSIQSPSSNTHERAHDQ